MGPFPMWVDPAGVAELILEGTRCEASQWGQTWF